MKAGEAVPEYLKLLSSSEVMEEERAFGKAGSILNDRRVHYILRYCQSHSSLSSLTDNTVFRTDTHISELSEEYTDARCEITERMVSAHLLAQIPVLHFSSSERKLHITSFFCTLTESGENNAVRMYQEAVRISAEAAGAALNSSEPPAIEVFYPFFEKESSNDEMPASSYNQIFSDILDGLTLEVFPHPDLLRDFKDAVSTALHEGKRAVYVKNYGLIPYREEWLRSVWNESVRFMKEKLIPRLQTKPALVSDLIRIEMEESRAALDTASPPVPDHELRRAQSIRDLLYREQKDKHIKERIPGLLVPELMISLELFIKNLFQREWNDSLAAQEAAFRNRFLKTGGQNPETSVRLIPGKEFDSLHPEIVRKLRSDADFITAEWFINKEIYHVIFYRNFPDLNRVMHYFSEDDSMHGNRRISFYFLLKNTGIPGSREAVPEFGKYFRKLEFRALEAYMPLIHRILLRIGIGLFREYAVKSACDEVLTRQVHLRVSWNQKQDRLREEEQARLREREAAVMRKGTAREIILKLDQHYLENLKIPVLSEVKLSFGSSLPDDFDAAVKTEGFFLVPWDKNNPEKDPILLYPADSDWRLKSIYLFRSLEKIFMQLNESSVLSGTSDTSGLAKARAVQQHLKKYEEKGSVQGYSSADDAYRNFEKAVKKAK